MAIVSSLRVLPREPIQYVANFGREVGKTEGLGDQVNALIQTSVVKDGIACVSRREEDFQGRMQPASAGRYLRTCHSAWQHHIGEQQIDSGLTFEHPQC